MLSHTPDEIANEIVAEFNTTAAFSSVSDELTKRISEMLDAYAQLRVAEMQERCANICEVEARDCFRDIVPGDEIGTKEANARVGALLTAAGDIRSLPR